MDSTGVDTIAGMSRSLGEACVIVHGPRGAARRVLDLTGITAAGNIHIVPCEARGPSAHG